VSRVSCRITAILVTLIILGGLLGPQEPIGLLTCDGGCLPDNIETHLLDQNVTTNISAYLKVLLPPPFYESETNTLIIDVMGVTEDYPTNLSRTMLGLDRLESPECTEFYDLNHTIYPEPDEHVWHYIGTLNITFGSDRGILMGAVIDGNTTLNLSYEFPILPPRVLLDASIDLPHEGHGWPEQGWASVPVLIENRGGLPATNLVVDFRYDGRIAATEHINVIPPHENVSVTVALYVVDGGWVLTVDLVQGPGAPSNIADILFPYYERPILDVVAIRADPTTLESGTKVYLEALVINRGNATADGQLVELMVDGTVVANASIVDLEPGNTTIVSTYWTLTGVGIHTVSALAEGDEFAAEPVAVKVKERTPAPGMVPALLAMLSALAVTRAARRSR
jgi:hypothetical protein